jgi:hypothetical protein
MNLDEWTRVPDADIPTWELAADPDWYVEKWGLGSWAAYHGDQSIGEPGTYGDRGEAMDAAETARAGLRRLGWAPAAAQCPVCVNTWPAPGPES